MVIAASLVIFIDVRVHTVTGAGWLPHLLVVGVSLTALSVARKKADPTEATAKLWLRKALLALFFAAGGIGAVVLLGFFVAGYPFIPQELGGPRPKCAILDLDAAKLSLGTLKSLGVAGLRDTTVKVARSDSVQILFTANEFTLVRTRGSTVHKLSGSVINAVESCPSFSPRQ
jgi:hypothetical protein